MTNQEFSDSFDTILNSHFSGAPAMQGDIVLDEYEKSVFLTKAQDELVIGLYSGRNDTGASFEETEELRRYLANLVKCGIYNFSRNLEGIKFLYNTPNSLSNVEYILNQPKNGVGYSTGTTSASYLNDDKKSSLNVQTAGKKIIGLANLTIHAGASTLTNMMVRQLNAAGIPSIGIEINRQDLIYYRSDKLFSCMSRIELERVLRDNNDAVGVIIDLNDFPEADKYCNSIVYLVEPSFIRLTKCIRRNKR